MTADAPTQRPPKPSAKWQAGYKAGHEAAVQELDATVIHWRGFGVRESLLKNLSNIADCIRNGWACNQDSHTAPECLARRAHPGERYDTPDDPAPADARLKAAADRATPKPHE